MAPAAFGDMDTKQPFGFRDIYTTTPALLYPDLKAGEAPTHKRHKDFQIWAKEEGAPGLKTILPWEPQPWQKQPKPSSATDSQAVPPPQPAKEAGSARDFTWQRYLGGPAAAAAAAKEAQGDQERELSEMEKAMRRREESYAHPPEVRTENMIPINAPPLDELLATGSESMPVVTLGVATPTEHRRLQREHYDMRNILLNRSQRCQYAGCGVIFPSTQQAALQQHLRDAHAGDRCNFCDEVLFHHWPAEQRYRHFVQKHAGLFSLAQTSERDGAVKVPVRPHRNAVAEAAAGWLYCPRCGRDHLVLDARADRAQHDSVCYFGTDRVEGEWKACETCGESVYAADQQQHPHAHRTAIPGEAPYCLNCALPLGLFSDAYRKKHTLFCKSRPSRHAIEFCPWCCAKLPPRGGVGLKHVETCAKKPRGSPASSAVTEDEGLEEEEEGGYGNDDGSEFLYVSDEEVEDDELVSPVAKKSGRGHKKSAAPRQKTQEEDADVQPRKRSWSKT